MRRRRWLVLLLAAASIALSACQVDTIVAVQVDDDGSGVVEVSVGLDDAAVARVPDLVEQLRTDDLEDAGWEVAGPERDDESGTTWIRASKPFADSAEAEEILTEVAGTDSVFQEVSIDRSDGFATSEFSFSAIVRFTDGLAFLSDDAITTLFEGDPFGGNLAEIEEETGAPAADQATFTVRTELPGSGPQDTELDVSSTEAQEIDDTSTTVRWAARAWAALAVLFFLAFVGVLVARVVRSRRPQDESGPVVAGPAPAGRRGRDDVTAEVPVVSGSTNAAAGSGAGGETASSAAAGSGPAVEGEDDEDVGAGDGAGTDEDGAPTLRLVVLDAMGVVFETGAEAVEMLTTFAHDHGSPVAKDRVREIYRRASLGEITVEELWADLGVEGDARELTDTYLVGHHLTAGVRPFLERMADRGLRVAVVANDVAEWSQKLRRTHKLEELTAAWIVSSELGAGLPDPTVYEAVMEAAGTDARHAFVIDAERTNVDAAKAAGFAAAWFHPDAADDERAGVPIIRSFEDLGVR